ncbi:MAG: BTAD domain-containing putative transcriptional regulator [Burkholderiales bacterium]
MVDRQSALPPKVSRPSAAGLVERERLFVLLDRFRRRPITWVEGPPGAGKTSLVSSWIEARRLPCLWYQVDAGDSDPATFFHYLRLAAPAGTLPLPALTPEHLPDLSGFTRRFFSALGERLAAQTVIVLDNFQDAARDAPPASLVCDGRQELPESVTLVILSRTDPPTSFAEAIAHADLARIGWDDLRLNVEETRQLAGLDRTAGEVRAQALRERTGGWAAGLRLVLESRSNEETRASLSEAPEAVFEYLAAEVFDRSPPAWREFWLATAYLPRFDAAMATALTNRDDAPQWLEWLASRRYFVERRVGDSPTYQYHALFADFLRRQLERHSDAAARQRLARRSAELLVEAGDAESAFPLYCDLGDFQAAIPAVLRGAPELLAQGRWQTLQAALMALPESLVGELPWLTFWLGAAQSMINPPLARITLQRAHHRFVETGDLTGQAMSVSAVIEAYFAEWDHLAELGPWVEAAEQLSSAGIDFPAPTAELRFCANVLSALIHCRPANSLAPAMARRARELVELDFGANEKLAAGSQLLHYRALSGNIQAATELAEALKPLLGRADVTPLVRLTMDLGLTFYRLCAYDLAGALQANLDARRIVHENGFAFADAITRLWEIWTRADAGDLRAASALLDEIEPLVAHARANEIALFRFLKSWFALSRGEPRVALHNAELAVQTITGKETYGPAVFSHGALALAAAECGETERAQYALARMRTWVAGLDRGAVRVFALMVEAEVMFRVGHHDPANDALQEALATGRRTDSVCVGLLQPDILARLCARALEAAIETEFARRLIATRGLRAPLPDSPAWPWPIRIHALGRFEIVVNGEVLRHARKAQRRVLDLLKALVALGADGVNRDAIGAALWPDSDGDASSDAFDVTLHRLRKLLGRDEAMQLAHGMLRVNRDVVWVDASAFERLAAKANGEHGDLDVEAAERALALYAGSFLQNEEDAPWLLPARERLRSRYTRLAIRAAQHYERRGGPGRAVEIYSAALEAEPLAEDLYRHLMTTLFEQGRHAEASNVYQRCRHMLSVVLGVSPSRETEAVFASITRAA